MRQFNDSGRATGCRSDQAPFTAGGGHCLRCRKCFTVERPMLPQAGATSMPPVSELMSATSVGWHDLDPSPALSPCYQADSCSLRAARYPAWLPNRLTGPAPSNQHRCKTHSGIVPTRRGFLHHAVSKPPRPQPRCLAPIIHRCGRGGPDTVLTNIGSRFASRPRA